MFLSLLYILAVVGCLTLCFFCYHVYIAFAKDNEKENKEEVITKKTGTKSSTKPKVEEDKKKEPVVLLTASELVDMVARGSFPKTIEEILNHLSEDRKYPTTGVTDNVKDEPYWSVANDIFIPCRNRILEFWAGEQVHNNTLYEHLITSNSVKKGLSKNKPTIYGILTESYLSAMVANAMNSIKPSIIKFDNKNTTGKFKGKMTWFKRIPGGGYSREVTENNVAVSCTPTLNYGPKEYTLEDLINFKIDLDNFMSRHAKIVNDEEDVLDAMECHDLTSLNVYDDVILYNLGSRFLFNSTKDINLRMLKRELKSFVIKYSTTDRFNVNTFEELFVHVVSKYSIFFQMYFYNFIYYSTLSKLYRMVAEYCVVKGSKYVTKEIFDDIFKCVAVNGDYTELAAMIAPNYIVDVLLPNEKTNSGLVKVYHTPLEFKQNSIAVAPKIEGVNYNPFIYSDDLSRKRFNPVILFDKNKLHI